MSIQSHNDLLNWVLSKARCIANGITTPLGEFVEQAKGNSLFANPADLVANE